jgi:hypothetical protein
MNLAVFYYSFGRNMIETKKLFDKYFKFLMQKSMAEFASQLKVIRESNDF